MTAIGTTRTTEEATENVCDLDMFVHHQLLNESPTVLSRRHGAKEKDTRMKGIQVSHGISLRMGDNRVQNRQPHSCMQPNTSPKLWTTRSEHQVWATTSDVWKQNYQKGFNHSRKARGSSVSTDVSPADVAIPPPALFLSAHPSAKPHSNTSGGSHILFTHFPKDPIWEVCRRTNVTRAHAEEILAIGRTEIELPKVYDMITADHKVLNEEQESR